MSSIYKRIHHSASCWNHKIHHYPLDNLNQILGFYAKQTNKIARKRVKAKKYPWNPKVILVKSNESRRNNQRLYITPMSSGIKVLMSCKSYEPSKKLRLFALKQSVQPRKETTKGCFVQSKPKAQVKRSILTF